MFKKKEIPKSIDFLNPINTPTDGWANTITWVSTVGKYLLIVVELVVVGVFASRFILDEKNNDLAEDINSKVMVLENDIWKQSAVKYDNLQKLFKDITAVKTGQDLNSTTISEVTSAIPTTLNVKSISVTTQRVSLAIETTDFKALKEYEESLKNNQYYEDVKFNISKEGADLEVSVTFMFNEKV